MPDAVSDSSPLIHLAKIEALELISRLYSRILIPPAVWREVVEESDGRPGAAEMQKAVAAGWMVKRAAKNETLVIAFRQTLDNGEAEAIALATELHPESVLLDDKLARQMARRLGVPVTGTLGVLLRAKQVGLIVELQSLITRLQSEGDYYIDPGLIEGPYSQLESRHDLRDHQLMNAEVGRGFGNGQRWESVEWNYLAPRRY